MGENHYSFSKGKLFIVGIGPGGEKYLTERAKEVIFSSQVIIGYKTYIDLISHLISGKEIISTGMKEEVKRCKKAIDLARSGKIVSLISSGDPGIYGMAGLVLELLKKYRVMVDIEIIPGILALSAASSILGAPLMNDFAVISLSDILIPWEDIEKRIELAAKGNFVIVFYNPKSKKRKNQIKKAREIILRYRKFDIPVGIVKNAKRAGESVVITNLKNMLDFDIDMNTTVIIGNSKTFIYKNFMITPRGYENSFTSKLCEEKKFIRKGEGGYESNSNCKSWK